MGHDTKLLLLLTVFNFLVCFDFSLSHSFHSPIFYPSGDSGFILIFSDFISHLLVSFPLFPLFLVL